MGVEMYFTWLDQFRFSLITTPRNLVCVFCSIATSSINKCIFPGARSLRSLLGFQLDITDNKHNRTVSRRKINVILRP